MPVNETEVLDIRIGLTELAIVYGLAPDDPDLSAVLADCVHHIEIFRLANPTHVAERRRLKQLIIRLIVTFHELIKSKVNLRRLEDQTVVQRGGSFDN